MTKPLLGDAFGHVPNRSSLYDLLGKTETTERRMVVLQWLIMPLVLAGYLIPPPRANEGVTGIPGVLLVMLMHPFLYAVWGRLTRRSIGMRNFVLTATDITVATLIFYATAARPGYAQVLLYCAVALTATRFPTYRAFGITSLIALLLFFAVLLPLHVSLPTLMSEIVALYVLTYLVGLLARTEKAISLAAIENAELAETVIQRNRELDILNRLSRLLSVQSSAAGVLSVGIEAIATVLDVPMICAYLIEDGVSGCIASTRGEFSDSPSTIQQAVADEAVLLRETVVREQTNDETISVPLIVQGTVRAVVQANGRGRSTGGNRPPIEMLEMFCSEVTVALENSLLRGEAHRTAILKEKNRIAQELHDTVLQMLFSVGLRLQWSIDHLAVDAPVQGALAEARKLSAQAGEELRGAIFTLSSDIADVGLIAAVERLVQDQSEKAGWSANVVVTGTCPELPVLVQNGVHRVVREALMNAYKHAKATEVVVSIRFMPSMIAVVVQDNGQGLSPEALGIFRETPDHFGLRTVARQIEDLGGHFTVYNNEDEPVVAAKAIIPLVRNAAQAA